MLTINYGLIIILIIGVITSIITAWFFKLINKNLMQRIATLEQENSMLKTNNCELKTYGYTLNTKYDNAIQELNDLKNIYNHTNIELEQYKINYHNYTEKFQEQKQDIINIKMQLSSEFENLANRIFEEKNHKFSEQNKLNFDNILNPFKYQLQDFKKTVEHVYEKENIERISLRSHIDELNKLSKNINMETHNLTKALKGDNKTQGAWGEMILESILARSGLIKNQEYLIQNSFNNDDGDRYRPDVIINLPDNKSLIIDSKVSLTAYEKIINYNDNDKRNNEDVANIENVVYQINVNKEEYLKEHILSIRNHIKNLSNKNYHKLYQLNSIDFVLMFIPIESALSIALQYDNNLLHDALSKHVIIVSPTILLATIRTIYALWSTEKTIQNVKEIKQIGAEIYERLVNFTNELEKINHGINNCKKNYEDAVIKLNGNKGVMKSVIKLKELGIKPSKEFSDNILSAVEFTNNNN